jgi:hypothetical protein
MTRLLEEAFHRARTLSEEEQDALAATILAELEDERHWSETFAGSADLLAQLADEASAEHRAGRTHPLDPERM